MLFSWLKKNLQTSKNIEKRKSYRYRIPKDLPATLEIESTDGRRHSFVPINFNREAVAAELAAAEEGSWFKEATPFSCRLQIAATAVTFGGRVLRYDDRFVVLQYTEISPRDHRQLVDLFPRLLGHSLQKKELTDEQTRWYHGQNDTDLFVHLDEAGSVIRSLTFVSEDHYLYWNQAGGMDTARVIRSTYAEGFDFAKRETNPLKRDVVADLAKLQWFAKLWSYTTIEAGEKKAVQRVLEDCLQSLNGAEG